LIFFRSLCDGDLFEDEVGPAPTPAATILKSVQTITLEEQMPAGGVS
jgi:hypothetical protein